MSPTLKFPSSSRKKERKSFNLSSYFFNLKVVQNSENKICIISLEATANLWKTKMRITLKAWLIQTLTRFNSVLKVCSIKGPCFCDVPDITKNSDHQVQQTTQQKRTHSEWSIYNTDFTFFSHTLTYLTELHWAKLGLKHHAGHFASLQYMKLSKIT